MYAERWISEPNQLNSQQSNDTTCSHAWGLVNTNPFVVKNRKEQLFEILLFFLPAVLIFSITQRSLSSKIVITTNRNLIWSRPMGDLDPCNTYIPSTNTSYHYQQSTWIGDSPYNAVSPLTPGTTFGTPSTRVLRSLWLPRVLSQLIRAVLPLWPRHKDSFSPSTGAFLPPVDKTIYFFSAQ